MALDHKQRWSLRGFRVPCNERIRNRVGVRTGNADCAGRSKRIGVIVPHKMSSEEIRTFLQEAPRTAHLASTREDGCPHVATIWFMVDGDDVVFATSSASVKDKNLKGTGFAALSVDDSAPPFSYVALEGPVVMVDDMEQVRHWATIIAARYMGSDWAEEFGRLGSFPDDLLCRLTSSHMTSHAAMEA